MATVSAHTGSGRFRYCRLLSFPTRFHPQTFTNSPLHRRRCPITLHRCMFSDTPRQLKVDVKSLSLSMIEKHREDLMLAVNQRAAKELAAKRRAEELSDKAAVAPWEVLNDRLRAENEERKQIARGATIECPPPVEVNGRHDIVECDATNGKVVDEKKGLYGNGLAKEKPVNLTTLKSEKSGVQSDKAAVAWTVASRAFEEKLCKQSASVATIECPPPVEVNGCHDIVECDATNDKVVDEKKGLNGIGHAKKKPVNLDTIISEKSDGLSDKAGVAQQAAESPLRKKINKLRKESASAATIECPPRVQVNGCHDIVECDATNDKVVDEKKGLNGNGSAMRKPVYLATKISEKSDGLSDKAAVAQCAAELLLRESHKLRKRSASAATNECPPPVEVNGCHDIAECDATNDKVVDEKKGLNANGRAKKKPVTLATLTSEKSDGLEGDGSGYSYSDDDTVATPARLAAWRKKEKNDQMIMQEQEAKEKNLHKEELTRLYDRILVVDTVKTAKEVACLLTTKYKDCIHACDTEVTDIDVKQDTPVNHGKMTCFSIYCGSEADFGDGKCGIWVDVLDGEANVLLEFKEFFEDPSIKKVWHNYSFDCHIIENYGIKLSGFHGDTMHLARLWDSSRKLNGGYSLEALTSDPNVMSGALSTDRAYSGNKLVSSSCTFGSMTRKISFKSIFGKKKVKKDGTEGKIITVEPVEMLQRGEERKPWICYSVLDSKSTLSLFESLKEKLTSMPCDCPGRKMTMYDFYERYWRPFGFILVKMESEGMLVDRDYLSEIEKIAITEQKVATKKFRDWASKRCLDAKYMNVGSDNQLRQLFFGGILNRKDQNVALPNSKDFKVPNTEAVIDEGKETPSKYRTITLSKFTDMQELETDLYTPSGWPSLSGDALRRFAGKIPTANIFLMDGEPEDFSDHNYGTAFKAFGGEEEGKAACHAIAALCEVCSIDSLISNFILPLQGSHISGQNGRIHCSLNINTETGRLSARRPNLQNQPALEKDRYKIRQAFIAKPGNSLIVADYGQLELRILAHLANCTSMLDAFKAGGDFHSRTAINMYSHVKEAVDKREVLLEWHPRPGEDKPPVPLLKDVFGAERRKAKMLNFSIAYGKTPHGLAKDWKVDLMEAKETVDLWYKERREVLNWQQSRKAEARNLGYVKTLLGRRRQFPSWTSASSAHRGHIERAAINTPVQGSAADVAMCAMIEIDENIGLRDLGWKLLLQVHDEVILEGPEETAETAKAIVVECMSKPFSGKNILNVELAVDAKCEKNWYKAK